MKKLLSVVLALALCLTAMMGCFAVSAETVATSATINIAGGEAIKAGETATVTVTGSDFTDVCAADLVITLPAGFELVSVSEAGEVLVNDENGVYYVYDETANTVKYIDVFNFNDEVKALDLALVVTAPADAEDGEYAVTGAVVAANIDEEFLGVTINNGAITVQNEVIPEEPTETLVDMEIKHVLDLQSSINLGFTVAKSVFDGCVDVYAMCSKDFYDVDGNVTSTSEAIKVEAAEYNKDTTKYIFYYSNIKAFEMGSNTYSVFYGVKENGDIIYSDTHIYSIKQYAAEALPVYTKYSSYKKLCTVIVDMLNYGTAAQNQFTYNTANLVNADFSDYQADYASTTTPEMPSCDSTTPNDGATVSLGRTLSLESAITIDATFAYTGDISNLKVKFSYPNMLGEPQEMWVTSDEFAYKNKKYNASLKALKVPQMTDEVTFTLYDGDTIISDTRTYSISSYAAAAQGLTGDSYANLRAVTLAMMRFGASATAYFGR